MSIRRQCELLNVSRSTWYYEPVGVDGEDLELMRAIDDLHLQPFYGNPKYPYLLRELDICRVNQVWAADITYIPMATGFGAIWWPSSTGTVDASCHARLSNTMDTSFCVEALQEALDGFGRPQIFNTDQGAQFTADDFTSVLRDTGVAISMGGRGRWTDNVFIERVWRSMKYEEVFLHAYEPQPHSVLD